MHPTIFTWLALIFLAPSSFSLTQLEMLRKTFEQNPEDSAAISALIDHMIEMRDPRGEFAVESYFLYNFERGHFDHSKENFEKAIYARLKRENSRKDLLTSFKRDSSSRHLVPTKYAYARGFFGEFDALSYGRYWLFSSIVSQSADLATPLLENASQDGPGRPEFIAESDIILRNADLVDVVAVQRRGGENPTLELFPSKARRIKHMILPRLSHLSVIEGKPTETLLVLEPAQEKDIKNLEALVLPGTLEAFSMLSDAHLTPKIMQNILRDTAAKKSLRNVSFRRISLENLQVVIESSKNLRHVGLGDGFFENAVNRERFAEVLAGAKNIASLQFDLKANFSPKILDGIASLKSVRRCELKLPSRVLANGESATLLNFIASLDAAFEVSFNFERTSGDDFVKKEVIYDFLRSLTGLGKDLRSLRFNFGDLYFADGSSIAAEVEHALRKDFDKKTQLIELEVTFPERNNFVTVSLSPAKETLCGEVKYQGVDSQLPRTN